MTTFYICRHGQTENNLRKLLSGWIDTPLTGEGVLNAISAANKLKGIRFDRIISSDLGRAFRTAYIIAQEIGSDVYIDTAPALREVNYGDFAGKPYSGPDSVYPDITPQQNANFAAPNGESLAQMQARVLAYVQKVAADNPNQSILLVAHDGTINALYAAFTGKNIGIVDAESNNSHDFVARFIMNNNTIESFEPVR